MSEVVLRSINARDATKVRRNFGVCTKSEGEKERKRGRDRDKEEGEIAREKAGARTTGASNPSGSFILFNKRVLSFLSHQLYIYEKFIGQI